MASVTVHPPKTPVTKGSMGIAKATLPNLCKMPGPPAPFVPTPLPNIGKSGDSPKGYTSSVKVEGNTVAIFGASFNSMGDVASKGLGGGMVSMNTHGPTKFIGPGSLTVKMEGKSVHLLGEPMTNNNGPSGSPPNSATMTGVDQSSGDAKPTEERCKEIKEEFDLDVARYADHADRKSRDYQSHHVLQNAQICDWIPKPDGIAILLTDSHGGTEHGTITHERQNQRMRNKKAGKSPGPAVTFGELKQEARDDLAAGLEGKRKSTKTGKPMTAKEAKEAADCIVADAEKAAKKAAKKQGEELDDDTVVTPPAGCFAAGTLVRMASGALVRVEELVPGDELLTLQGPATLTRIDACRHDVVEIALGRGRIAIATYHRLFDAEGRLVRAGSLRVGDLVATLSGVDRITAIAPATAPRPIYRLGVSRHAVCVLGASDILAELPDSGAPVTRTERVHAFVSGEL